MGGPLRSPDGTGGESIVGDDEIIKRVSPVIRSAGDIARQGFRHSATVRATARGDVATDIDLKVDEMITSLLTAEFPDHGIISEESGKTRPDADLLWILDPIDGSKQYVRGIPLYGISLALRQRDELRLGVVYFPENDELFTAVRSEGAYLNGEKIVCSREKDLKDAIICLEIPSRHDDQDQLDAALARMKKLILNCGRARIVGIATFGLCHCASGAFGAYVNLGVSTREWDTAAGEIMVREAGGRVARVGGATIAAGEFLYDAIVEVLHLS
jgi:myo-inositol-1(or 4)-monophosphatase